MIPAAFIMTSVAPAKMLDNQSSTMSNVWAFQQNQSSGDRAWVFVQEHPKPFQCGLCSMTFEINVELVSHIHNHSLTKPYQCGYCKVSYDNNPDLTVHVKTHARVMIHIPFKSVAPVIDQPVTSAPQLTHLPGLASTVEKSLEAACEAKTNSDLTSSTKSDSGENEVTVGTDNDLTKASDLIDNCDCECDREDTDIEEYLTETKDAADSTGSGMKTLSDNKKKIKSEKEYKNTVQSYHCVVAKTEVSSESQSEGNQVQNTRGENHVDKSGRNYVDNEGSIDRPFHCDICGARFKACRYVKDHKRRVHKLFSRSLYACEAKTNSDLTSSIKSDSCENEVTVGTDNDLTKALDLIDNCYCEHDREDTDVEKYLTETKDTADSIGAGMKTLADDKKKIKSEKEMLFDKNTVQSYHCVVAKTEVRSESQSVSEGKQVQNTRGENHVDKSGRNYADNEGNIERPFHCDICDARFRACRYVKDHKRRVHKMFSSQSHQKKLHDGSDSGTITKSLTPDGQALVNKSGNAAHLNSEVSSADVSSTSLFDKSAPNSTKADDQNSFQCSFCGKCFKTKESLRVHVSKKHFPLQCTKCRKWFKFRAAYFDHWCRPKECPVCKLSFSCRFTFKYHWSQKHEISNFQCNLCDKSFGSKKKLNAHNRIHTKEKPYTCEFCGQSFARPLYLTYHQNSFHLNNRPYKCNICQTGFNSHGSLSQHKRRHLGDKRYHCAQCDKMFYNSGSLRRHALTHTDLRSQVCSFCGKTYRSSSSLRYHLQHYHQFYRQKIK